MIDTINGKRYNFPETSGAIYSENLYHRQRKPTALLRLGALKKKDKYTCCYGLVIDHGFRWFAPGRCFQNTFVFQITLHHH